jgi:thioredoxin 1
MIGPIIDEFAMDSKGRLRVGKLNVATSPSVSSRLNIMGVPFLFIYDNGQLRETLPGIGDKQELMMKLSPYI